MVEVSLILLRHLSTVGLLGGAKSVDAEVGKSPFLPDGARGLPERLFPTFPEGTELSQLEEQERTKPVKSLWFMTKTNILLAHLKL